MPIRILIADDIAVTRRQIRAFLQRVANWEVCGEAIAGLDAIAKTRELTPDVILLDLAMPRMNLENQLWNRPEPVLLRVVAVLLACALPLQPNELTAEQVPVRHKEGLMHGFLALRTLEGKKLADGEMTQVPREIA